MKMDTAAFEENATIYHIDLPDGVRSLDRGPKVTFAKKVGTTGHKLTFGLLNRHRIAGWEPQPEEHLSFAFVCTGMWSLGLIIGNIRNKKMIPPKDAKKNQKLRATSVLQLKGK